MSILATVLAYCGWIGIPAISTVALGGDLQLLAVLALQVEPPTTDPTSTNPALWANLIWVFLGIVMLVLLVGAALFAVRRSGDRRMG